MSRRVWVVGGLVAAAAVIAALSAGLIAKSARVAARPQPANSERGEQGELGGSQVFRHHQEDLFAARGDPGEGPTSWAQENFELNGGDAITAANIAGARAASGAIRKRGLGQSKNSTSSWVSLGPTSAIYPAFLNRHHSQYITSGRITALAITPDCTPQQCRVWVAAAGGGVWRTDKGLAGNGNWVNVSDGSFASGAIGALSYDAAHHTLYAGTGEDAAAGDAEAGVGIYKSTDGGDTWTALGGNANFVNRAIRDITIDPNDSSGNTFYVADGRGVHGISSTTAGAVSQIPGAPGVGVWKTTDGGASFTLLSQVTVSLGAQPGQTFPSSFGSTRGATRVKVDPTHPGVVYASAYNVGVWRSTDNGANWTNIHPCAVDQLQANGTCGAAADRSEIALTTLPNGDTRMYQTEGDSGPPTDTAGHVHGDLFYSRFFVADGVQSGSPAFTDKTSAGLTFHTDASGNIVADSSSPGYATYNFCTGQCWYDQGVISPAGHPNVVYVFGSYLYNEDHGVSNARGLLLSRDGGNTFTDLTDAATGSDASHDGLHPDQHALVVNPNNPLQYWEGDDGGLMRSDGTLVDISARCDGRNLVDPAYSRCKQLLSAAPGTYTSMNKGLQTLQFQSLSVNPANPKDVQGGTQDNGTFETTGSSVVWPQTIFGDGGLSGFDATNPSFRFHTYFNPQVEVNFNDGAPPNWDWIADPFFASSTGEPGLFYFPIISDPTVHGSLFAGTLHAWRTTDDGGPQAYLDSNCNRFTGAFAPGTICGDWAKLGDPSANGRLTCAVGTATPTCPYGASRSGGNVSWLARGTGDDATLWAATTTGRVLISKNANAAGASSVAFTRLDSLAANAPNRPVSSISVDPANPNHAFISYLSYNALVINGGQAALPGHVFSVTYNPVAGTATWTSLDGAGGSIGDQPVNGIAYDPDTGDLYAATDFGVAKLADANPANDWVQAATRLPVVTVAGLTINPGARQLLAATHGRGAYQLTLP